MLQHNKDYVFKAKLKVNGAFSIHSNTDVCKNTHKNEPTALYAMLQRNVFIQTAIICSSSFAVVLTVFIEVPLIVHSTIKSIWFPDRPSVFCWTMRHTSVCAAVAPTLPPFAFSPDSILVSNGSPPFPCQINLPGLWGVRDPIWNDKACPETADPQKRPGKSSSPQ